MSILSGVICIVNAKGTCADYLVGKEKMNKSITAHVENSSKLSRKAQLESYDGCARLRPVFDELATKYDAIITPSVVDEAPVGIASTGDAVSSVLCLRWFRILMVMTELLFNVDNSPSALFKCARFCR